jgi:protein-arginine kinase
MMEDVLLAEVLLRRNYQDLQFCPQDKQEDMEKSRSRGLSKAGAMLPGSVTYDAKGLLKGNLPYLQELLLPSDFRRLNEAALVVSEQAQQAIAVNMDEHLVLKSWGGAEQVEELIEKTRLGESQVQDDNHPFAQDAQFGFLSYRPQLAGSGLHVSLVLHLPMLHFLKQIRPLME